MYTLKSLLIVCMIVTLVACVEGQGDMEDYVAQVKKEAKGKVEPLPPPRVIKSVDYTAINLRNPFILTGGSITNMSQMIKGPGGETIQQQPRPDLDRPREYLEQFPLTSLSMVGTLSKPQLNWGLVKDSNGMIHAVKVGDYMGQNSGIIIAITPDQIRLNETVPNGAGGWMQTRAALTMIIATDKPASADPQQAGGTQQ